IAGSEPHLAIELSAPFIVKKGSSAGDLFLMPGVVGRTLPQQMGSQNIAVFGEQSSKRHDIRRTQRLEEVYAVRHGFGTTRMPYGNHKRGIWEALNRCLRRLDGEAFDLGAP